MSIFPTPADKARSQGWNEAAYYYERQIKELQSRLNETKAALRDLWFSDLDNFCADFWLDDHPEHRAVIERLTRREGEK